MFVYMYVYFDWGLGVGMLGSDGLKFVYVEYHIRILQGYHQHIYPDLALFSKMLMRGG